MRAKNVKLLQNYVIDAGVVDERDCLNDKNTDSYKRANPKRYVKNLYKGL